jgi:6-pyruvoyltetrahydropterin/6-carboxytetrahydropterin synthase
VLEAQGEPLFLMDENPTAENIAKLVYRQGASKGLPVVEIRLWESPTSCATYRE